MIKRALETIIEKDFFSGKTILLMGPRQVGKTTLLKQISEKRKEKVIWLNGDNPDDRSLLNAMNGLRAKQLFTPGSVIIIDEAQRLENSGLTLKIIHDNCENIQLIATGSSSFELTDKIKEALTGRKWSFKLYPVSLVELSEHIGWLNTLRSLETRLIYGSYPEIINHAGNEKRVLNELVSDYLYKEVFALKDIRKPEILEKLLQAIAFQIGHQVSHRELSNHIKVDKETVQRYLYLLEEAYIIFSLKSFSRNLRNELKRSKKYYFHDTGIRNAVISRFSPLEIRDDTGALWENFMILERLKSLEYSRSYSNIYFWRTTLQKEIDYLEERDGKIYAYEFKWSPSKKAKLPLSFAKAYPETEFKVVNKDNFFDFVSYSGG